jgi:hypothetical protein
MIDTFYLLLKGRWKSAPHQGGNTACDFDWGITILVGVGQVDRPNRSAQVVEETGSP